jgi:hypothetical protein
MGEKFVVFHQHINEYTVYNSMYEHWSTRRVKISVGHLYPYFSAATLPKRGAKMPRADHVSVAWLAKVCNSIKQYRRVHSSFMQTVGKITVRINKEKIIQNNYLKCRSLKIMIPTVQNNVRALSTTQQL